jgi:hypothetical protein
MHYYLVLTGVIKAVEGEAEMKVWDTTRFLYHSCGMWIYDKLYKFNSIKVKFRLLEVGWASLSRRVHSVSYFVIVHGYGPKFQPLTWHF